MKREIDLAEVSDGRIYGLNDMVKADCGDCAGCSACCQGMGSSIVLTPYDCMQLSAGTGKSMQELLADAVELGVVDGIVLPNLKMNGKEEKCYFLNQEGRCSVHEFRPGICRLFPLGRIYEDDGFGYFLQIHECKCENRSKVKVKKWIDEKDLLKNQKFILRWHNFLKAAAEMLLQQENDEIRKQWSLLILKQFYLTPFSSKETFYEEAEQRILTLEQML